MSYIEINIEITPFTEERAEIVEAMIEDLGFESFAIEEPFLRAYIKQENFSEPNLKCILSYFDNNMDFKIGYSKLLIPQQNWNKKWESSFEPIVIDNLCTIKADYHKNIPLTAYNIKIRPNMAFGTGYHQTTVMMIRMLMRLATGNTSFKNERKTHNKRGTHSVNLIRNAQVLDMGTGTGVLSIMAAKLGAKRPVHAIDIDINAVNSAKENFWKNRLHRAIQVLYGDASLIQANKYNLILANINRNILLNDMSTYSCGLRMGGLLLLSGFYECDIQMLINKGAECGFTEYCHELSDDTDHWAILVLKKTGNKI